MACIDTKGYKPVFEFHIAKAIRAKYHFQQELFSTNGRVVFANFQAVREFVYRVNQQREAGQHLYPGEVNAAALLEEIYHLVLRSYEIEVNPDVFNKAYAYLERKLSTPVLEDLLLDFVEKFPPHDVYQGQISNQGYLAGESLNRSHTAVVVEEILMLYLANFNPANRKLKEFMDEEYLKYPEVYYRLIQELEDFFEQEPPFGPDNQDIIDLFKTPILRHPKNIQAQLEFILEQWKTWLPAQVVTMLLKGQDLLKEDVMFDSSVAAGGPPPTMAPPYKGVKGDVQHFTLGKSGYNFAQDAVQDYAEYEHFTSDRQWMPSVVLLAKNTYVWLDQLSKKYKRSIRRLDQIPDEELDLLRQWNFTGLWLIGIWERSEASRRIKHIMGNTDAVSSAYSLFDYVIAHDLGGEEAYQNLNQRAQARGLRLASDMVPNHTGLYSRWTIEHPDYFIQTAIPPFPAYRFTGENLSQDPDIEIRIDDGYYSRSDAAVVFQRIDKRHNDIRYIYHGNDGTVMPWNDTAQLDMLKQEVREAVIQKIFEVARRFSIIRFDAAMTLAKKHFARLWYPRPGTGGDIPSRADYAMSQQEFDRFFPVEFWREVVDRINNEMPETLLLAEAFWFMEGYFVRTLGMHRVYNSAFMHMLKNEENLKYRDLITETLEFEPEILKRYVNFMSNPDEETAIQQFGTGDKYFGVCVLMNTLPGLPMFAHGQIEGYTEKYGMEYQRAYYNESPHGWLVSKHEREIFPLTRKRYLFSEVEHFNIFDYIDNYGNVNENVFAYSNRHGHERVLVLYNNKYESAEGKINYSAHKLTRQGHDKVPVSIGLASALDIKAEEQLYYIFTEHISGLEYIRTGREILEKGFHWNLNGFEYRVFWNFREVKDETGELEKIYWKLGGRGITSIQKSLDELRLQSIHQAYQSLFSSDIINFAATCILDTERGKSTRLGYRLLEGRFENLVQEIGREFEMGPEVDEALGCFRDSVGAIENAFDFIHNPPVSFREFLSQYGLRSLQRIMVVGGERTYRENLVVLLAHFIQEALRKLTPADQRPDEFIGRLQLHWPLEDILSRTGKGAFAVDQDILLLQLLSGPAARIFDFAQKEGASLSADDLKVLHKYKAAEVGRLLEDPAILEFIRANEYEATWYFSKETIEELTDWLLSVSVFRYFANCRAVDPKALDPEVALINSLKFYVLAVQMIQNSEYKLALLNKAIERLVQE